jgi:hypothetical protein
VTISITPFGVSNCLAEADFDLPSALKKIKPSIVGIGTYSAVKRPLSTLLGTGFVIADGSLALIVNKTNHRQTIPNPGSDAHFRLPLNVNTS